MRNILASELGEDYALLHSAALFSDEDVDAMEEEGRL